MTDIFEEVETGLREDKLQSWLRKYWLVAIGAVVAVVLGVVLYNVWGAWRQSDNRAQGEKFAALQQQAATDPAGAIAALSAFQRSAHGGYKALAEMERAGALQAQGDLAGALAAFDSAAKLSNEPVVKQSAQLRAAYLAAETENFAALDARLKPLIDARGPFSYLARELIGVKAYEDGQVERARTEFTYLESAFDAPEGVRNRASSFLAVLGPAPQSAAPAPAAPAKTGEKK